MAICNGRWRFWAANFVRLPRMRAAPRIRREPIWEAVCRNTFLRRGYVLHQYYSFNYSTKIRMNTTFAKNKSDHPQHGYLLCFSGRIYNYILNCLNILYMSGLIMTPFSCRICYILKLLGTLIHLHKRLHEQWHLMLSLN